MDARLIFELLSFGFSAYAYYPYFKKIKRGAAHPTISTWICWLLIDSAILAGMIAKDAVAYQVVAYVFGVIAVLVACFQVKTPLGWKLFDTACMILVSLSMIGWAVSGNLDIEIIISVIAFTVGCGPLLINIYEEPEREPIKPWLISCVGATFGVLAISKLDIVNALSPIVFLLLSLVINVLILRRKPSPAFQKFLDKVLLQD